MASQVIVRQQIYLIVIFFPINLMPKALEQRRGYPGRHFDCPCSGESHLRTGFIFNTLVY